MWYLLQESPCCALYKPSMTRWESKVGITSRQLSCLKNENDKEKKRFREHVQWWALFCKGLAKLKFILLVLCFLSVNWNDWNQEMVTGILKRMEYRVVQSSSALVIKWSNYLKIFMSFLKLILKACWFNINIWRGWQGLAVKHFELSVVLYAHYLYLNTKNGRGCDEICVSGFLKSCLVPRLKPYDCRRGIFSFFPLACSVLI